ncbi:MAG: hypothetical protein ABI200_02950 [Gaiellales bacterium]
MTHRSAGTSDDGDISRASNARNNAMHQALRLERWQPVRSALWKLVEPLIDATARVAIVGAGSCDDVPLTRMAEHAAHVDLIDFDRSSTDRAIGRLDADQRARVGVIELDVTGGSADLVLRAARDNASLPEALPIPYGPLADEPYDLVIGDMIYTQLLHAGLLELGIVGKRQRELMRRYDRPLVHGLVQRIEASLGTGGHGIHIHDLACWASGHKQPCSFDEAVADPDHRWTELRRHDNCDPHLVLEGIGARIVDQVWWPWEFEPNKQFLVRATVTRAATGASLGPGVWRRR